MNNKQLIKDYFGFNNQYTDHYGVEIEAELNKPLIDNIMTDTWRVGGDGSLRGNGVEFVLRKPLKLKDAKDAVQKLLTTLAKKGYKVIDNGRAGVHVHVNVGDLNITQMANLAALTLINEDLLAEYCGDFRKGNLFCLRMKDAEYIVDAFTDALVKDELQRLHTDNIRYAFLNLKALPQYGSFEYRAMRSDGDADAICDWLDILDHMKGMAKKIDNPLQIVADVSERTPEGFLHAVMGDKEALLPKVDGWQEGMYRAIRRVQLFAYCKEW